MNYKKNIKGCSNLESTDLEMKRISRALGNYLNEIPNLVEYLFLEKRNFIQESGRGVVFDVLRSSCRNIRYSDLAKIFATIMTAVEGREYQCFSVPFTISSPNIYSGRNMDVFNIYILDVNKLPSSIDTLYFERNRYSFMNMVQNGYGVCISELYYGSNPSFLIKDIDAFTSSVSWSDEIDSVGRFTYLKDFLRLLVSRQYLEQKLFNKQEVIELANEFVLQCVNKDKIIMK